MITLPNRMTGGGSFGEYYPLSKGVGVKVLYRKYKTLKKAVNSATYKQALKEAQLLAMAQESGVVPRCYGVTIVKDGNKYGVGILMQHLGNKTLENASEHEMSKAYDEVNDALLDIGISHYDLHEHNIMKYRGKYYAIDFSPKCVMIN